MKTIEKVIKPIGGYFELQIENCLSYHPSLIALNTGRNALEYILRIRKYSTIFIPFFTCDVLLEPLKKLNVAYYFYQLDRDLNPIIDFELGEHTCMLYTNYFGIKSETVELLSKSIKNLIIDNAQAFYAYPLENVDTFYSCRKFFGVPDGAYLYTTLDVHLNLQVDHSISRFSHLIKSIDFGIEEGYVDYLDNNKLLENNEIKKMSMLTQKLLAGIDYVKCAEIRRKNFNYLHKNLSKINMLKLNFVIEEVPMVYPLLIEDCGIKERLINNKIFVATYWPNVFDWIDTNRFEYFLSNILIPLPIDHRYTILDMREMLNVLNSIL
ncbi:hypothetical protein ACFRAE_16500 [Sphingobacterium sp. HJSM2_6]|uniref:hypothetical protein n=1 Tax=Sphingobacterium sp. HJSM2_6 TaxID=3366264 RepID=UPI003BDB61BF